MTVLRRLHEFFIAFIAAMVMALLTLYLVSKMIDAERQYELHTEASKLLRLLDETNREVLNALRTLNSLELHTCNEINQIEMRKALFRAKHIKDIGFFEDDKLVCTTGLGVLETPVQEPPADFMDQYGNEIWSARELIFFEKEYNAIIHRSGLYNVVIDPKRLGDTISSDYLWQAFAIVGDKINHFSGEGYLHQDPVTSKALLLSLPGKSSLCDEEKSFCVLVEKKPGVLLRHSSLTMELALITGISLGILVYMSVKRQLSRRQSLSHRVKRAITLNTFSCAYQPIVELHSGEIVGVEMLARLSDKYGVITPDKFIEVIRGQGLTWQFTQQIIEKALSELNSLESVDKCFKANFNIYPNDVVSNEITTLKNFRGMEQFKGKVVLEIIENEYLEEKTAQGNLAELKKSGFELAIDDFGTGYSNLNQLKKIEGQILKIDRSFVIDVEDASIRSSIIEHIVDIAHEADMHVVAEGIEKSTQHQALMKMGVEYGQGWAFGKPMSINKLAKLLSGP